MIISPGRRFIFVHVPKTGGTALALALEDRAQAFDHPAVGVAKRCDFAGLVADPLVADSLRAAPYASYMRDGAGVDQCNAWVRLEHLDEDLAPVVAYLGFALRPLARTNASDRLRDHRPYYDDDSAARIARLAAEDIARFGYRA